MDISGKVALVTGGAGGIGKAIARAMLQKQAKAVFLLDTDDANLATAKQKFDKEFGEGEVHTYKCDVTSKEQMEDCFKSVVSKYGDVHIVCNNAGISDEINWEKTLTVNLLGVIMGSKLAVQYMKGEEAGGGVIINTASSAGLCLHPGLPIYSTTKYGIIGFTKQIATFDTAVLKKKIRVNVICPGGIATPLQANIKPEEEYRTGYKTLIEKLQKHSNFLMTPDDFAQHFMKLIEEPHHGVTLFVENAEKSEMIADETAAFREKNMHLAKPLMKLRDSVLKST